MSGSADLRKRHSIKKNPSDGTLKEYTYTAKVSKQQSGASLTANQGLLFRTNFYGHSPPSAVSRRADVSF